MHITFTFELLEKRHINAKKEVSPQTNELKWCLFVDFPHRVIFIYTKKAAFEPIKLRAQLNKCMRKCFFLFSLACKLKLCQRVWNIRKAIKKNIFLLLLNLSIENILREYVMMRRGGVEGHMVMVWALSNKKICKPFYVLLSIIMDWQQYSHMPSCNAAKGCFPSSWSSFFSYRKLKFC